VRKVTLQDLADSLGVARSTVSRALREDPQISQAMRSKVQRLAAEVGYRPNAAALALMRRSAGVVGLLLPRTSRFVFANPYFSELLEGIASVAEAAGLPLLVTASARPDYAGWLREGRVDGVITLGSSLSRSDLCQLSDQAAQGSPVVLVHPAAHPSTLTHVSSDECPGLAEACRHLAGHGHRRVAIVTGPAGSPYARGRAEGWRAAAHAAGLEVVRLLHGDDTFSSGEGACRALLRDDAGATAWLLGNDLMAFGASSALAAAGRRVPHDVSLIGFDDVMPAALVGLSTVRQPVRELGAEAMRALLALMRGDPPHPTALATRFVPRHSSGPRPRAPTEPLDPRRGGSTRTIANP
jgi:DNA-binding LacI/PurR family transcriptional regulator